MEDVGTPVVNKTKYFPCHLGIYHTVRKKVLINQSNYYKSTPVLSAESKRYLIQGFTKMVGTGGTGQVGCQRNYL